MDRLVAAAPSMDRLVAPAVAVPCLVAAVVAAMVAAMVAAVVAAPVAADSAPSMDRLVAPAVHTMDRPVAAVVAAKAAVVAADSAPDPGISKRAGAVFPGYGSRGQDTRRDGTTNAPLLRSTPGNMGESRVRRWAPGIDATTQGAVPAGAVPC